MRATAVLTVTLLSGMALAGEPTFGGKPVPRDGWVKVGSATISRRADVALVYCPVSRRFLALGGEPTYGSKPPLPYDDLALDAKEGRWENWYPRGRSFGPRFGPSKPPGFKRGEAFRDAKGGDQP